MEKREREDIIKEILWNECIQLELEMEILEDLPFSKTDMYWVTYLHLHRYTKEFEYEELRSKVRRATQRVLFYTKEEDYEKRCKALNQWIVLEGIQERRKIFIKGFHYYGNEKEQKWLVDEFYKYVQLFDKEKIKQQQIRLWKELLLYKKRNNR